MRNHRLESRVRENRTHGSEGGEGESPFLPLSADQKFPAQAVQHRSTVRFAGCFSLLDSGFRRNDGLMDNLGL